LNLPGRALGHRHSACCQIDSANKDILPVGRQILVHHLEVSAHEGTPLRLALVAHHSLLGHVLGLAGLDIRPVSQNKVWNPDTRFGCSDSLCPDTHSDIPSLLLLKSQSWTTNHVGTIQFFLDSGRNSTAPGFPGNDNHFDRQVCPTRYPQGRSNAVFEANRFPAAQMKALLPLEVQKVHVRS